MLQNWFILLPETTFAIFWLVAWMVHYFRKQQTAKTFFTLGKAFLIAIAIFTIVFYNLSAFPEYFINTPYTTLFKTVMYLVALAWFYLSSKWFLNKNRPSFLYYQLAFGGLFCLELLISAQTFVAVGILIPAICFINWKLLRQHWDENAVKEISRLYAFFAVLFCLLLNGGLILLYWQIGSLDYIAATHFFAEAGIHNGIALSVTTLIMAPLFFMLALAPFHSCFVGMVKAAVLPVSGYLTLIVPIGFLSVLMHYAEGVFAGVSGFLYPVLTIFAVFSMVIGALSANGEKNIRELFAFGTVYHLGFLIFALTGVNSNGLLSAFSYMLIYIFAMVGVYNVFLGMKRRGAYLSVLENIDGFSVYKPYMSAALLVFMFSLIGVPPLLGFLGRLSVISNLLLEGRWGSIVFLLTSMLFMANAYLKVVRSIYFEAPEASFDRTDKAIYICLFVNMVLVVISILNPRYLLEAAALILKGGF